MPVSVREVLHDSRPLLLTLLFIVSLLAALAAPSHAQFTLYDNFAGGIIDPDLWQGHSTEGSFGAPTTEFIRIVENSALRLALTSWGDTTSNTNSTLTRRGVQFKQLGTLGGSGSIIGVRYKLTTTNAAVEDCAANTAGGLARAQFLGWFFNDTQSTPSSDATGNIIAGINVTKLTDGSNRIEPVFVRCMNSGCITTTTPSGVTLPTFASTWSLNTPLTIRSCGIRRSGIQPEGYRPDDAGIRGKGHQLQRRRGRCRHPDELRFQSVPRAERRRELYLWSKAGRDRRAF